MFIYNLIGGQTRNKNQKHDDTIDIEKLQINLS